MKLQKFILSLAETYTDRFLGLPLVKELKTFKAVWDKLQEEDQLLRMLVNEAYTRSLLEALEALQQDFDLSQEDKNLLQRSLKRNFVEKKFQASAFDMRNFYENDMIKTAQENYITDFIMHIAQVENTRELEKYIQRKLERNFYRILARKKKKYQKLQEYIKSDTYKLDQQIEKRLAYEKALKELYPQKGVMNQDNISLKDLYIEPYFLIHENSIKPEKDLELKDYNFIKDSLHHFVHHCIDVERQKFDLPFELQHPDSRFLLLLGEPGQGKTSFCKRFLYDCFTDKHYSQEIFYIKLRHLEKVGDLLNSPLPTLRKEAQKQSKMYGLEGLEIDEKDFEKGIILLDGLDELYMRENFDAEKIEAFFGRLLKEMKFNLQLKIIITSRFGPITPEKISQEKIQVLRIDSLDLPQQQQWLKQYKTFQETILEENYLAKLNEGKKDKKGIAELICQPVILHIVATLPKQLNPDSNKASIYKELFDSLTETVVERSYDKEGKLDLHRDLCKALSIKESELPDYLRELIQEIAFAIFQTGKDYINKNTLYKHESPILQEFFQAVAKENYTPEDALKLLMMSFYIQDVVPKNTQDTQRTEGDTIMSDYALEFLHKSLQEYLVAEYIGKEMEAMTETKKRGRGYSINEGKKALELAWRLFAPRRIGEESHQVVNYLIEIIQSQTDNEKQVLAERLQEFLPYCLENNFLLAYNHQTQPKLSPLDLMQNTFYGYWTVFAYSNQKKVALEEDSKDNLASLLNTNTYYHILNLQNIDLSGAKLSQAQYEYAKKRDAILEDVQIIAEDNEG